MVALQKFSNLGKDFFLASLFSNSLMYARYFRQSNQVQVDRYWMRTLQPHGYRCVIHRENELSRKAELDVVAIALLSLFYI